MTETQFPKLQKSIKRSICLVSVIMTGFICVFSSILIYFTLYDRFKTFSRQNVKQEINSFNSNLSSINASMSSVSENSGIINLLMTEPENYSINVALHILTGTLKNAASAAILTADNIHSYIYGQVVNYPGFDSLASDTYISGFLNSAEDYFVSVRTSNISSHYNFFKYPEELGIISVMRKIRSPENNLPGIIIVDILPGIVFSGYFAEDKIAFSGNGIMIANTGKNLFQKLAGKKPQSAFLYKGEMTVIEEFRDGFKILAFVNSSVFNLNVVILLLSEAALFIISNILVILMSNYFSGKITKKLDKLLTRMKEQEL